MSSVRSGSQPSLGERHLPSWTLTGLALAVVLAAGLNKALLFRNLRYPASDLFSFLEMTRSWFYAGRLLHDNAYGYHGAIHNFYGLLAFAPMTLTLGAYGLFLGLVLAHGAAVLRVGPSGALDPPARLAVLAGFLGPMSFYAFDDLGMGFHPELLYPPLALLLAVELLDGWSWRSVAVAGAIVLVKEDGAVVCAAVVLAHTAWRVAALRGTSKEQAWRAFRSGFVALAVFGLVFLAGMALLGAMSDYYSATQRMFSERVERAIRLAVRTASGRGPDARFFRLRDSLELYAAMSLLMLLPLGRRIIKGLLLFFVAIPPVLIVVVVSSAFAVFTMMFWAPRVATIQAVVVAALLYAAVTLPGQRPARVGVVVTLALLSWAGQATILHQMQYSVVGRLVGLASFVRPMKSPRSPAEDRFLRCVASRLPRGLPVEVPRRVRPAFHHQSIVLPKRRERAWHPARLRIVDTSRETLTLESGFCSGPAVGRFAVQAECSLVPRLTSCDAGVGREGETGHVHLRGKLRVTSSRGPGS